MRRWAWLTVLGVCACTGSTGQAGPSGPTGPAGSADTPEQVLGKLVTVDGAGSGLDADFLQGRSG